MHTAAETGVVDWIICRPHLALFRTLWGCDAHAAYAASGSFAEKAALLRRAGYDGVEASLADLGGTVDERAAAVDALRSEGMELIVGTYSSWCDYDESNWIDLHSGVDAQLERFEAQLADVDALGAEGVLRRINAHSGSDAWSEDESHRYFSAALPLAESKAAAPVSHETHRGRPLANPFTCQRLCLALPTLRLTLDASHWFLVCERLIGAAGSSGSYERDVLQRICERVDHIHARVGTPEAPQVAALGGGSAWEVLATEAHEALWCDVWSAARERGAAELSATPEYGPAPYTPMKPGAAGTPLTDVWEVTNDAARRLRQLHSDLD